MKKFNWKFILPLFIFLMIYIAFLRNESANASTYFSDNIAEDLEDDDIEIDSVGYDELDRGDIIIDSTEN